MKTRKLVVETHYFGEKALYPKAASFLEAKGFTVHVTSDRIVHASRENETTIPCNSYPYHFVIYDPRHYLSYCRKLKGNMPNGYAEFFYSKICGRNKKRKHFRER